MLSHISLAFGFRCPLGHLGSLPLDLLSSLRPAWLPYQVVSGQHSKRVKVDVARSLDVQAVEATQCHLLVKASPRPARI